MGGDWSSPMPKSVLNALKIKDIVKILATKQLSAAETWKLHPKIEDIVKIWATKQLSAAETTKLHPKIEEIVKVIVLDAESTSLTNSKTYVFSPAFS